MFHKLLAFFSMTCFIGANAVAADFVCTITEQDVGNKGKNCNLAPTGNPLEFEVKPGQTFTLQFTPAAVIAYNKAGFNNFNQEVGNILPKKIVDEGAKSCAWYNNKAPSTIFNVSYEAGIKQSGTAPVVDNYEFVYKNQNMNTCIGAITDLNIPIVHIPKDGKVVLTNNSSTSLNFCSLNFE